jgi:ribosomal protein S18 acetylase RimI-like enzyme
MEGATLTIRAKNALDEAESADLDSLVAVCEAYDGAAYLEKESSLNAHREMPCFFCAYEGKRLLGAMTVFAPKLAEAELGALVLPGERRRGIFSSLLSEAEPWLSRFGYAEELFVVEARSAAGRAVASNLGAIREFSEYSMSYDGGAPIAGTGILELRRLGLESIPALIELRSSEFGDSREEAEAFEKSSFAAPNRRQYGAFLDGRMIGASSLGFEDARVSINGLVIEEAFRGKGYGQALLGELLSLLSAEGLEIALDVDSENANAFHIYRKLGFTVTMAKEYYRRRIEKKPAG